MSEQLVTQELSFKLKAKGFNEITWNYFFKDDKGEITDGCAPDWDNYNRRDRGNCIARPTLSQAADWLRAKGLHVHAAPNFVEYEWHEQEVLGQYTWAGVVIKLNTNEVMITDSSLPNYEEALLYGVTAAVEMVG